MNVQFVSRFIVRTAAFFGCMIVVFGPESAGVFEIESFNVSNQIREVSFPTDTNNYYTLLTGAIVTNINQPVAMMVGTGDTGVLRDTNAPAQSGFYRVRALPAAQAADSDGDGIDDAYELRNPGCLDPLNATDAGSDCDDDGRSNLSEYHEGTNLTVQDPSPRLVINEVDYDQLNTDTHEFVELLNLGTQAIDLRHFAVVLINGVGSAEYLRVPLTGVLPPGEFLVIGSSVLLASSAGTIKIAFSFADNNIQNGAPDGLAVINIGTQQIYDALSYEGSITAANINGFPGTYNLVEGSPTPLADNNSTPSSLQRSPSGADSNNAAADWILSSIVSPGTQ